MNSQPEPTYRGLTLALAALLALQVAGALAWQQWFRAKDTPSLGFVPQMHELTRERRYDEAIQAGLGALKHSSEDDVVLQQIALVFLRRAQIEAGDKEQNSAQATEYAEKALAANPSNQSDLYGTARVFDIAADFTSSKKCAYYRRSLAIFQDRVPLLTGESVMVEGRMAPTGPLRQENDFLLQRVKSKMAKAGCSS